MSDISLGLTPEEKQALLAELQEAYFSGVSKVRFKEREVTYRSLTEMKQVIDDLTVAITPTARRKRVIMTTFRRGFSR